MALENLLMVTITLLQTYTSMIQYSISFTNIFCLYILSTFISSFYLLDQLNKIHFPLEDEYLYQALSNFFRYNTYVYIIISNIIIYCV